MRFGKGLPLTAEQRAVHGIRADETLALHARIAELEIIAQYAGEDNAMAEQYAARIAELEAENAKLRTALKPFSDAALYLDENDVGAIYDHPAAENIGCNDLRAARAAYLGERGE